MDAPTSATGSDFQSPSGSGDPGGSAPAMGDDQEQMDNPTLSVMGKQADAFGLAGKKAGDTVTLKVTGKITASDPDSGTTLEVMSATPMDDTTPQTPKDSGDGNNAAKDRMIGKTTKIIGPKSAGFDDM